MTNDDFRAFLAEMGWEQKVAAEKLGKSKATIEQYCRGQRANRLGVDGNIDKQGRAVEIPYVVDLACAAIRAGLKPYSEQIRISAAA